MNLQLLIAKILMIILSLISTTETTDTSHSVYGTQDWRTQYIPTYEAWRTKYHKETYNSRRHSRKSFSAWVTNFIKVQTQFIFPSSYSATVSISAYFSVPEHKNYANTKLRATQSRRTSAKNAFF